MRYWILLIPMLVLSAAGAWINWQLTHLHYQDTAGTGVFAEVCTPEAQEVFDCKAVTRTKWAMLPPNEPDPVTGEQLGLPIAVAGWFYFSAIFIWYLLIGRCDYEQRLYYYLLLAFMSAGLLTSLFYTRILLFGGMEHKCLWCLIAHGINLLLFIGTILLRPRRPVAADQSLQAETAEGEALAPPLGQRPHPSSRLTLAALLCIVIAAQFELTYNTALSFGVKYKKQQARAEYYKQHAEIVYRDTGAHIARYEAQEDLDIPIRPDDPAHGDADFPLTLVVFSDFQCPGCRGFAKTLEKSIAPDFEGALKVVWKHYPLSKDCNPYIARGIHPQACEAAYAAEAARIQGGNDAFWRAHDLLFEKQKQLRRLDYRSFAQELGLDPDQFIADMQSEAVRERVAEDVALGKKLEIRATPSVFLGDRKIERFMLTNEGFREAMNYRLQRARKQKAAMKRWQEMSPEERKAVLEAARKRAQQKSAADGADDEHAGHDHAAAPDGEEVEEGIEAGGGDD